MGKQLKGEKYIYLLMGLKLAKNEQEGYIQVGEDNGMKGGDQFWRSFRLMKYQDKFLLIETKTSRAMANYHRAFEVERLDDKKPIIREYINESGENASIRWEH